MDCSCVYTDYGEPLPEFHKAKIQMAKKNHKCCECKRTILPFEKYEYVSGMWEGDFLIFKTCIDCLDIRKEFFCDGWLYEGMKEALWEHLQDLQGEINEDCLASLTPNARAFVCKIIERIWEDYDEN